MIHATPVSGYNLVTWFFEWIGGRDPIFGIWISVWVMLVTGVLGGFTTFSAFSLDAALLIERHSYRMAGSYIVASVVASIAALFCGLALFRGGGQLP